jgi:hypothetical protein
MEATGRTIDGGTVGRSLTRRCHCLAVDGASVYNIQPGHDAWVVGDQEVIGVEFDTKTAATFAKE